jgi:DNA-directed RNA polymerase subunit beta'
MEGECMKLEFFNIDKFCEKLAPITSNKIYTRKGFHPDGMFSEKIFGPVRTGTCSCGIWWGRGRFGETCPQCGVKITHSSTRRKIFGKIVLPFKIINPIMYFLISKVGKMTIHKIIDDMIADDKISYYYDEKKKKYIKVVESIEAGAPPPEYPEGVRVFNSQQGLHDLILSEAEKRKETNSDWNFIYENWDKFYIQNIIVLPPEFRPVSKSKDVQMRDKMNEFYLPILNFTLTMNQEDLDSSIHSKISSVNFRNLHEHVMNLYNYIFDKFSKKTGLIRGFILGKRIDFSGRAVITPDPTLKLDECSLPYTLALELYKLDVAEVLLQKRMQKRYDPAIKYIDKCIELNDTCLIDILRQITADKSCMLNRQPTLHRLGILTFKIKINTDYVIKIHPLVCEPYNADFDGDQMAVYISLYEKTQKESVDRLGILSNLISPSTGNFSLGVNQDIVLGLYYLTKEGETPEVILEDGTKTTQGRVEFNKIFPTNFPFMNCTITKTTIRALLNVLVKNYDSTIVKDILDNIKDLGFKETTLRGCTMSLENIEFPEAREIVTKICDDEKTSINEKFFLLQTPDIKKKIKQSFPYSDYIESGSRGSWDQAKQLTFCRGFISNSKGEIIPTPIKSSLLDGLNEEEFFISCYGSRKALLDVALNTGVSGYLTRKLVYCAVNSELGEEDDCGTTDTLNLSIPKNSDEIDSEKLMRSLIGRWVNNKGQLELITDDNYRTYIGKDVEVRSPIFCKHNKICKKCYGDTYKYLHSNYIGILSASALGEVATQLTLRTFHIGGIAQMSKTQTDTSQKDIINDLSLVKKMLHGHAKLPFDQLIMELFKVYVNHKTLLLVHFEIIVSQMMRKNGKRWRTQDDRSMEDYELISIENVPSKESFLLALAFSKPYSYIVNGILESTTTDGILERIMTNEI